MDDAISFRESYQSGQLTGVGVGIQVEAQPNCFETNRSFLVYAERASKIDIPLRRDDAILDPDAHGGRHSPECNARTGRQRFQQHVS